MKTTADMGVPILGQLPLVPHVSSGSDQGVPVLLKTPKNDRQDLLEYQDVMKSIAQNIWTRINSKSVRA